MSQKPSDRYDCCKNENSFWIDKTIGDSCDVECYFEQMHHYYNLQLNLYMKKLENNKQLTQSYKNYPVHRNTEETKLANSQTKIKAFVNVYDNFGDFSFDDLGDLLSSCFTFFRKIATRNQEFYKSLLEDIQIRKYTKGQVLTLLNEPAETAIFILQGKAGVYVKGGMSPERAKGYKQEYGEQFHLEVMNAISKRKSNLIQEQNSVLDINERRQKEHSKAFHSQEQIKQWFPALFKSSYLSDLDTIDQSALKRPTIRAATVIAQTDMVVATINKNQFKQKTFKHDNIAVQTDQKLQILRNFGLFKAWDTKLNSLAMYFERKKFKRGDIIYAESDPANGFYLIISGDIQFYFHRQDQVKPKEVQDIEQEEKARTIDVFKINLELLNKGSYFGQTQLLKKTSRKCTAECRSATVEVFFLNKKNFFLIGYETDLFYLLKQKMPLRQKHRDIQQKNGLRIKSLSKIVKQEPVCEDNTDYSSFVRSDDIKRKSKKTMSNEVPSKKTKTKFSQGYISNEVPSKQTKTKFYHGYIVPDMSRVPETKAPYFSMLESNKQMYKETVKKFRRFMKQPKVQYKPDVNWNLKRVWKVLNLNGILEEESQLSQNKEGLEFFYKHERHQNQIAESRSVRPKTSSCSYQDKVKYIRYLDNFDKSYNRRYSKI